MNGLYPFTPTNQQTPGKSFRSLPLGNSNSTKPKMMILAILAFFVLASTNSGTQAQPLTETPPPVVALPMNNLSGFVGDDPVVINLNDFFDTTEDGTLVYEVSVNAFPDVAHAQIDDNILTVTFDNPGQTNITIKALFQGAEAVSSFVAGAMPVIEGDYVVTDFTELSLEPESFWNGSDESGGFASGLGFFPNSYNPEWGAWSGWAYSNITDNTTPGWFNQYSAITGAAVNGTPDDPGIYALTFVTGATALTYNHPSAHEIKGMFITNTTYTALSMMFGDDFSKKFGGETGDDPDWFKLTTTGLRNGTETGTIDYYLADYRFDDNSKNYIIQTWQWLELSTLGKVDTIMFSLSSSDLGDWGMNTPAYFAADHLFIVPDLASLVANPVENSFKVYPNPSTGQFNIEHNKGEDALLTILNTVGQIVYQSRISIGSHSVNLASLPAGTYIIRLQGDSTLQTSTLIKH